MAYTQTARHHHHPNLMINGNPLNILPVTDHQQKSVGVILPQPLLKRIQLHGTDHQGQFFFLIWAEQGCGAGFERSSQLLESASNVACFAQARWRGRKEPAHLKNGYQALTGKLAVHNGKRSDIELIHDFQGFTGTGVGGDLNDLGLHDIAYSGSHISHEPRRGYPEFTQDKLNPIIDVSTSGSDGIWHTYLPFEVSIGNGRANAIHVWVAMSDDE
jgi:hypothetical protein